VKQLCGEYRLGEAGIDEAKELMETFAICRIVQVRCEENKEAHALARQATTDGEAHGRKAVA
jgi:hypothetical protein